MCLCVCARVCACVRVYEVRVRLRARVPALLLQFVLAFTPVLTFGGGEGAGMWVCVRAWMWDAIAKVRQPLSGTVSVWRWT